MASHQNYIYHGILKTSTSSRTDKTVTWGEPLTRIKHLLENPSEAAEARRGEKRPAQGAAEDTNPKKKVYRPLSPEGAMSLGLPAPYQPQLESPSSTESASTATTATQDQDECTFDDIMEGGWSDSEDDSPDGGITASSSL